MSFDKFWDNTVLGVSCWPFDQKSIDERVESNITEDVWTNKMNEHLQKFYLLDRNLSAVFIDSWSQQHYNWNDSQQQDFYRNETDKLWQHTTNFSAFHFTNMSTIFNYSFMVIISGNMFAFVVQQIILER